MRNNDKEKIKSKINEELEILKDSIDELKRLNSPIVSDCSIGSEARTNALYDQNMHRVNLRAALIKMDQLKKKIAEMEKEDFGKCGLCGEEIGVNRLMAMPQTEICINCANNKT